MIVRSCPVKRTISWPCSIAAARPARPFHSSSACRDEGGNHYDTLDISVSATHADIKRQFYKLSKSNHPDLHPNDPSASQKFVKISEAYATLGSAEKRQRYDRDFMRTQQQQSSSSSSSSSSNGPMPQGSYSSASTGPGGRPASGLSRRRTQFRGPPPSFYRSGGWGDHSEKRSEHAKKASHTHETNGQSASGPAGPGMGPGGFQMGFDGDVPHFDNRSHAQTHSELENRHRTRRRRASQYESAEMAGNGSSTLFNFLLLTGVLGIAVGTSAAVYGGQRKPAARRLEPDR